MSTESAELFAPAGHKVGGRMIYVVLGMHKSGTTLVSKTLHESGINMGEFDGATTYDEGNKYERFETLMTNIALLGTTFDRSSIHVINTIALDNNIPKILLSNISSAITRLNSQYKDWGFKDPRLCLTYGVWSALLPVHKLIAVIRSPHELIEHYENKGSRFRVRRAVVAWKALKAWHVYNTQILEALRKTDRPYIVIEYGEFLRSDEIFKELSEFAGRPLTDVRDKSLFRHKGESNRKKSVLFCLQRRLCGRDALATFRELQALTKNK